jgi:hypothetical protein
MWRNFGLKLISMCLAFAVSGCATDQQRTRTGGAVIGVIGGAVVGALGGAAFAVLTGNRDDAARFIVAGTMAGAALGGRAGYRWGERVAYRKEQYKTSEDRMVANINRASEARVLTAQENKSLRGQIAELRGKLNELAANRAAGRNDQAYRTRLVTFINQRHQDVAGKLQKIDAEITDRSQALADDRAASPQKAVELQARIAGLRAERSEMQQLNQQLAAIRPRIGV